MAKMTNIEAYREECTTIPCRDRSSYAQMQYHIKNHLTKTFISARLAKISISDLKIYKSISTNVEKNR